MMDFSEKTRREEVRVKKIAKRAELQIRRSQIGSYVFNELIEAVKTKTPAPTPEIETWENEGGAIHERQP
jgi:hypothetical protein